jgi:hypothetical protein
LGRGSVIKFKIKGWRHFNTVLDYNAPCQKDIGFFFMPISKTSEIISAERCSEMDIILDLWINTIYNDEQVEGSGKAPVVYMRNGTGSPLIGYAELALRWGLSKATAGRILKKLEQQNYLTLLSFPGRYGSLIYLNNYLSTMFQISDVMIDKEEIAMSLNIKISLPEADCSNEPETDPIDNQLCVSNGEFSVSKPNIKTIVKKVLQTLSASGLSCCECPQSAYKLSPLSACKEKFYSKPKMQGEAFQSEESFILEIACGGSKKAFIFELTLISAENKLLGRDF